MTEIRSTDYFAIVPEYVLYAPISSNAVRLYAILNRFANSQGRAWPSRKTLADLMQCSTATIDRAKDELVEIDALTVEHRTGPAGDPSSNLYTLKTSSPVTKGSPKNEQRGTLTVDALNKASMKQSQTSQSSKAKTCNTCIGRYRVGYEDETEEGLSHVVDEETREFIICPKCHGTGKQPG
jgi:hypothetical protein